MARRPLCLIYGGKAKQINEAKIEKRKMLDRVPFLQKDDIIGSSVRQYCRFVNAELEKCSDFESKRKFLLEFVEKIIYQNGQVTLSGAIPLKLKSKENISTTNDVSRIAFSIQGNVGIRKLLQ